MFLSTNNALIKAVLSSSGTPMILVDEQTGHLLDANDAAVYLYKLNRKQLKDVTIQHLWGDETVLERLIQGVDARDDITGIQQPVIVHTRIDDDQRVLELFPSQIAIDGKTRLFVLIHDITKRYQVEQRLTLERLRWKALLEHSHDLTLLLDKDGIFQYASPAWQRTLGLDLEPVIGESIEALIHPDDRESFKTQLSSIHSTTDATATVDCRFLAKNQCWHWIELKITNKTHVEGLHDYIINGRSVHERKNLIKTAKQRQMLLNVSQQIANMGSWEWDVRSNVVTWSDETYRIYGYEPGETDVNFDLFVKHCHPEDRNKLTSTIQQSLSANESFEHYHRIQLNEGCNRIVYGRGIPVTNSNGELEKYYGICYDITDQKHLESQLVNFTRELEQHHHAMEQFTCVASHDLKEPLRKIIAFGERLKTKYSDELPEAGKDYVERMQSASHRMNALIDALLEYSRLKAATEVQLVDVDLNETVEGVLNDLELRIEETGAIIEKDTLPVIHGDPLKMRQLFQNLLANALKFVIPDRQPHLQISAKMLHQDHNSMPDHALFGDMVEIVVRDNGVGFPEEMGDRMFEPFKRLHARKKYKGTGMGLAICKTIVERHHGSIQAIGKPNEGAAFVIKLPLEHATSTLELATVSPCGQHKLTD